MYDMEKLICLLKKAQGERSLRQFARESNTNAANLSKIYNKKNNFIPTPNTLKYIAQIAYNGVTYEGLMIAAGHLEKTRPVKDHEILPNENEFTKEEFKELLIKARGNRTNTEYAEDSNVNRTYLSKYINCKMDVPPTPKVIRVLANTAYNGVTYEALMEAAGYITNRDKTPEISGIMLLNKQEKRILEIMRKYDSISYQELHEIVNLFEDLIEGYARRKNKDGK